MRRFVYFTIVISGIGIAGFALAVVFDASIVPGTDNTYDLGLTDSQRFAEGYFSGNVVVDTAIGVGTTTPAASALIDLYSTSQGFLSPRMTATERDAITSPATGLLIYNRDTDAFNTYDGTAWTTITSGVLWNSTGTAIYNTNSGNAGIGTSTPSEKFQLYGGNFLQTPGISTSSVKGTIDDETNLYAATSIAVSGRYAYVVSNNGDAGKKNFAVVDISNPGAPAVVGSINDDTNLYNAYTVAVSGRYAYVVSDNAAVAGKKEFTVIDISNPAAPAVVGTIDDDVNLYLALSVTVSGRYAYVVSNNAAVAGKKEFTVIDISNPAAPSVVGTIDDDTGLYKAASIAVSGRYAYVVNSDATAGKKNFAVVDISNPTAPSVVGSIDDDTNLYLANSIAVSGHYAYVANSGSGSPKNFAVVDIGTPASPVVVGSINDETNLVNAWSVAVSGRYAYVADKDAAGGGSPKNFAVIDISGLDITSAQVGSLEIGGLQVRESAVIANGLSIGTGLNVGAGGIFSDGPLAIGATSSPSYFGGSVMIATTTTSTVSAKLVIGGQYYSALKTITYSGNFDVNWDYGNVQQVTLAGSSNPDITNGRPGGIYTLLVKQDGTGGRTVTWPPDIKWPGDATSTLSGAANALDVLSFAYDGTNYEVIGAAYDVK